MTQEDVKENIRIFLVNEQNLASDAISDGTHLLDDGVLDSVLLVKLVAFLESTYAIALDPEDITAANLESIGQISRLVAAKAGR